MDKKLHEQLKQMKGAGIVHPDAAWVKDTRASLLETMSKAPVSVEQKTESQLYEKVAGFFAIFVPGRLHTSLRVGTAVAAVFAVAIGGWSIGVQASQDSLPGDLLYSVKLAGERTQIAVASVTGNDEAETKLHLKSAKKRSEELTRVTEPAQATAVLNNLKKSTASAEKSLEEVKQKDQEKAEKVAKEVAAETEEISQTLKEVSKKVAVTDADVSKEVNETRKEVDKTSLDAVSALDPAEAKQVVEKKLAIALQETQEVKDVVLVVSSTTKQMVLSPQTVSVSTTTSGTSAVADASSTPDNQILATSTLGASSTVSVEDATSTDAQSQVSVSPAPVTVKEVDASLLQVDQLAKEAQEFLDQDNVVAAVQKVRAIRDINSGSANAILNLQTDLKKKQEIQQEKTLEAIKDTETNTIKAVVTSTLEEVPATDNATSGQ